MGTGLPARLVALLLGLTATMHAALASRLACVIEGETLWCLTDEQYISMRYARNLAAGDGLVWNAGEPAVEGISNFLWAVWMAVGHVLPLPDSHVALWVVVSSSIALLGASWASAVIAARLCPGSRLAPAIAWVGTGFYFPLSRWALQGFEVGAVALLLTAGVALVLGRDQHTPPSDRQLNILGVLLSVALLVRLDSASFIGCLSAWLWFRSDRARRRAVVRRVFAPVAITFVVFEAFRLGYYGDWLPNTVILKIGGVPLATKIAVGFRVLARTFIAYLWVLAPAVGLALATRADGPRLQHDRIGAAFIVLGQLAYILMIGGDTWEEARSTDRPLSVAMPIVFALTGVGLGILARLIAGQDPYRAPLARKRLAPLVAASLAAAMFWSLSGNATRDYLEHEHCKSNALIEKIRIGLHLRREVAPDSRVAVVWAGAVPYFSQLPAIDLLGKSDRVIARLPARGLHSGHNKWDYAYSIGELEPDVIASLFYPSPEDIALIEALGYRSNAYGVWFHPRLDVREFSRTSMAW